MTNSTLPTVTNLAEEKLSKISQENWAPGLEKRPPFSDKLVSHIYYQEVRNHPNRLRQTMMLEYSQYLENYLIVNYAESASVPHILSMAIMINEKFRERVPTWKSFDGHEDVFKLVFHRVLELLLLNDDSLLLTEQTVLLVFLMHCINSLEVSLVRNQIQRLVSLPIWVCLSNERRNEELKNIPELKKFWSALERKDAKSDDSTRKKNDFERNFLSNLIKRFLQILLSIRSENVEASAPKIHFCERFIELMIDLEAFLPTRRFFNTVLDSEHVVVACKTSSLAQLKEGRLFVELLERLEFYAGFEINDHSGEPLNDKQMLDLHYKRVYGLQKMTFKLLPELREFSLLCVSQADTRQHLLKYFNSLSTKKLNKLVRHLNLVKCDEKKKFEKSFLTELIAHRFQRRKSQLEAINSLPLYPVEKLIWDKNIVPGDYFTGEGCLALPKLNLQFLTLHDYLLRNFNLLRLESTYELRQDFEDALFRLKPYKSDDGITAFRGWARYAMPIDAFTIIEVAKPKIGEAHPSSVRADLTITLNLREEIKSEWEALRLHDSVFLVTIRAPNTTHLSKVTDSFDKELGVVYIRGCEVEGMLDEDKKVISDIPDQRPVLKGNVRSFRVHLDPNQYQQDMTAALDGQEDIYQTFNIVVRRNPKQNNFKAILETIRDLMNTDCVVPDWLHDLLLGYGDPDAANYKTLGRYINDADWNDTFLSYEHLVSSFPLYEVVTESGEKDPSPPFVLNFEENDIKKIVVKPHIIPNRGPYPFNKPRRNSIKFTPTQIEAIHSGMQPGLTMVVGPPGTGKTDVAVQIISNLYHNWPDQRTLIVTHSNQALNQLFEKIIALDVDERHLLRLGHGEEALETEKDYSRYGRVNYILAQRIELLDEVKRLQNSLGVTGDVSHTCETAGHFFLYQVMSRWEEFYAKVTESKDVELISNFFPFTLFFCNAPQPLFKKLSYEEDMEIAEGCWRHIRKIFTQLEEYRAFELLRSGLDRSHYLLVKESKIIAMTCTHAALKRREMVQLGFQYDNILMEESAQILEIETFIPLLLQNPVDSRSRLKRWIMIGDHHQLPPVIQNMAFQKYSNMEQSLFTRLVRLGVPTIDLDAQGRARSSICELYNWRYKSLGNLPHVEDLDIYQKANTGLCFDYQLIDVGDFNGVGESEPMSHFFQNLAEAEYVVALYVYLRLIGHPASSISILTTYNGQRHLIQDIVNKKCLNNPLIGVPKVSTVDKYQGQQNDFILLSLVRTKSVGHLRDVRRLIVAMSRARLGLYIFGRVSLFRDCIELSPTFKILVQRPLQLFLLPHEEHPTNRKLKERPAVDPLIIQNVQHMCHFVYQFYADKVSQMNENLRAKNTLSDEVKSSDEVVKLDDETEDKHQTTET